MSSVPQDSTMDPLLNKIKKTTLLNTEAPLNFSTCIHKFPRLVSDLVQSIEFPNLEIKIDSHHLQVTQG